MGFKLGNNDLNVNLKDSESLAARFRNEYVLGGNVLSSEVKQTIYNDIANPILANEVWKACNTYCKEHAVSHPELTTQGKLLSNFVNADPDLYCSLPLTGTQEALSAMPTRWNSSRNNSGSPYADLGVIPTVNTEIETKVRAHYQSQNYMPVFLGEITNGGNDGFALYRNSGYWRMGLGGTHSNTSVQALYDRAYSIKMNHREAYIDGVLVRTNTTTITEANVTISIFTGHRGGSYIDGVLNGDMEFISLTNCKDNKDHYFVPSKINETMEWLDLETLTLATRLGTFTEQKDIPNS